MDVLVTNSESDRPLSVKSLEVVWIMSAVILLVDDDRILPFVLNRTLSKEFDGQIRCVSDGKEGIDYLSRQGRYSDKLQYPFPSVVLLDLDMPIANGFEVLEWKRQHAELRELPVVVWSSSVMQEDQDRVRALGAVDYVTKPMNAGELLSILRNLADLFPTAQTLPLGNPCNPLFGPHLQHPIKSVSRDHCR